MRSLLLSAVLGLATLGTLFVTPSTAEAQRWRGRDGGNWNGGRSWDNNWNRGYYGGYGYYDGYRRPYYNNNYYYSSPGYTSYYYEPSTTTSYSDSRYYYYWSNGWYICYDRTNGDYWYQDPSSRTWYRWR